MQRITVTLVFQESSCDVHLLQVIRNYSHDRSYALYKCTFKRPIGKGNIVEKQAANAGAFKAKFHWSGIAVIVTCYIAWVYGFDYLLKLLHFNWSQVHLCIKAWVTSQLKPSAEWRSLPAIFLLSLRCTCWPNRKLANFLISLLCLIFCRCWLHFPSLAPMPLH